MRKSHVVLLSVTLLTLLFSAYSLAAINQVYTINFEWYSQYNNRFISESRNTLNDKWRLQEYPETMEFQVVTDRNGLQAFNEQNIDKGLKIDLTDTEQSIFIYCTLGKTSLPEFRMKVIDLAQRENIVEVKISLNSSKDSKSFNDKNSSEYFPSDFIRVQRVSFPVKGQLRFIFKNQDGNYLYECLSYVK